MHMGTLVQQSRRLAQSRHQPLDTPHLLEVLLDYQLLPIPKSEQTLVRQLLRIMAESRHYTQQDPFEPQLPETLYVHSVLTHVDDYSTFLHELFWGLWSSHDEIITLFRKMDWIPNPSDHTIMTVSSDMSSTMPKATNTHNADFIPDFVRRDQNFWPVHLSPIMRGTRIGPQQYFLCTHLLSFPDYTLVSALATGQNSSFLLGDSGENFFLEARQEEVIHQWRLYDAGGLTLCRDYRFKGQPFVWEENVSLQLVINLADQTTQTLLLTEEVLNS